MKTMIIEDGIKVTIDDADLEWAKDYKWFISFKGNQHAVVRVGDNGGQFSLAREIAIRLLGQEILDGATTVYLESSNPLDLQRSNIIVKKRLGLAPGRNNKIKGNHRRIREAYD